MITNGDDTVLLAGNVASGLFLWWDLVQTTDLWKGNQ
jgi:hypothetical protein